MPTLGQKHRHLDMSWLLIGHNRTAKVRIYLLIINIFRKKVEKNFSLPIEKRMPRFETPSFECVMSGGYFFFDCFTSLR